MDEHILHIIKNGDLIKIITESGIEITLKKSEIELMLGNYTNASIQHNNCQECNSEVKWKPEKPVL